jgi:virginiamycin B lyase
MCLFQFEINWNNGGALTYPLRTSLLWPNFQSGRGMLCLLGTLAVCFGSISYAQTPLLIRELPVPGQPTTMASGPDGAMWFTSASSIGRIDESGASTQYFLPMAASTPQSIVLGPDGALWFTEALAPRIGRITATGTITEYAIPNDAVSIVPGPDGAMWFNSDNNTSAQFIGRITTGGAITIFTESSFINAMTAGPDGALWFTEESGGIGRITTTGVISEYPLPNPNAEPYQIITGPDGALWFTEIGDNQIGRITTGGVVSEYPLLPEDSGPIGICVGPDGALWFVDFDGKHVGRVTAGVLTEFAVPTAGGQLRTIVTGPDGALWFAESNSAPVSNIARITTAGVLEEFPTPTPNANPQSLTLGPDGKLWFVETGQIGRVETSPTGALRITSAAPMPIATAGLSYSWFLTAFGGAAPYTWTIAAGSLPAGLSLSPAGAITGTPLAAGVGSFTVQVMDSASTVVTLALNLAISQPNCTYLGHVNLSGSTLDFPSTGGTGSITVIAAAGCYWNVRGAPAWLTITSGASGVGNAVVNFSVAVNRSPTPTAATLNVGGLQGLTVHVNVQPAYSSANVLTMPHLAAEGGWKTTFTLINKSLTPTQGQLSFSDNGGNPLALPLTFTPQPIDEPPTSAFVDQSIPGNGSLIVEASGPENVPYVEGSAQVAPGSAVDGFAIFHYDPSGQEAVIPLQIPAYTPILLFDNTNGVSTGVALENPNSNNLGVDVTFYDTLGNVTGTGGLQLSGGAHTSFVLASQFPVTANARGAATFTGRCSAPSPSPGPSCPVGALGIRYTLPGTLTTVPVLANGGLGDGVLSPGAIASLPHIASGNGWQTTFVLYDAGGGPSQATLNFLNDQGNPLVLPLTDLQTGAVSSASSWNASVVPGSSTWLQTSGSLGTALLTGSAQLVTSGAVSGYAIFRYNPNGQEAVVPLETRTAGSYLIAFDNANNTATGIALSLTSSQAVDVPYLVRDGNGNQIASGAIQLQGNGHTSFMLSSQIPATTGITGSVEFDTPSGTEIAVLGIRSPPALTFTTLPALAR